LFQDDAGCDLIYKFFNYMFYYSNAPYGFVFHFALMQNETKNQGCIPRRPTNGLPAKRDKRAIAPSLFTPLAPSGYPDYGTKAIRRLGLVWRQPGAVSFMDGYP